MDVGSESENVLKLHHLILFLFSVVCDISFIHEIPSLLGELLNFQLAGEKLICLKETFVQGVPTQYDIL